MPSPVVTLRPRAARSRSLALQAVAGADLDRLRRLRARSGGAWLRLVHVQ